MSIRSAEISKILIRFLDRYSPPLSIKDKPQAVQDEADGLLRIILRFAPNDGYAHWVDMALERCAEQMKTRAWPTMNEMGAVCSNMRKETAVHVTDMTGAAQDECQTMADRISKKMPIGDSWVYGLRAVELVDRGYATEADLDAYRSGLFFSMKASWGHERAVAVENEFKSRHEAARIAYRDNERRERDTRQSVPDKTSPAKGYAA